MNLDGDPRETFREEAHDLLADLEQALLGLESAPGNRDLIDRAFRDLHTLKGSGNMFGFQELGDFAHAVENVFVLVRDGKQKVTSGLVSASLRARDHIMRLLEETPLTDEEKNEQLEILTMIVGDLTEAPPKAAVVTPPREEKRTRRVFRIAFSPSKETFLRGTDPLGLISELREMGELQVIGHSTRVPDIAEIDPERCYLNWDVLLLTESDRNMVDDVFIFLDEDSTVEIQEIDPEDAFDSEGGYKRLGDILVDRGDITSDELERILKRRNQIGEILVREGVVDEEEISSALEEQKFIRSIQDKRPQIQRTTGIKVQVEKLDTLVNIVGEFVSLQAQIALRAAQSGDRELVALGEQMERLVQEIRDLSIDLHMVPVDTLFTPFRRLVRDLAAELGKEVDLRITGAETELDKNMIDELRDPLLHIVRNAIDHGIEAEAVRIENGKDAQGHVELSARYSGALVIISVEDDGAGIDTERVRATAVERGLIDADDQLGNAQVLDLLFRPGFSTAKGTTQVSGRGVGMDVVRRNVEALNGSVSVTTVPGHGSRFEMRMPLTLAIVEGLLARIGETFYLINLAYIVECLEHRKRQSGVTHGMIDYRGSVVPLLDLRTFFDTPAGEMGQIVVVGSGADRVGLVVDELFDSYQSVVKSLGRLYDNVPGLSGAVFLGDGTPALMLDVERLIRMAAES